MPEPAEGRRRMLPWLLGAALLVALVACGWQLARTPGGLLRLPLYDYAAFWSASRLNALGEDPHDPDKLAPLQREANGHDGDVLVMWSAPWGLTLFAPFSRLDAHPSHALWLLFLFAVLAGAVDAAWRLSGGPAEQRWVAWLVALTYLPCSCLLVTGQLGGLVLLGFVGFLCFLRRGKEGLAGAALVLAALKPQLTYLFWIALLLWAVDGRRWRLVLGGILGGLAAMALPLWENPHLLGQYWHALAHRTQTHSHVSPLAGTALRLAFGLEHFRLQFVPMVPGLLWLAWYWRRHRRGWDWGERLPALLFASLLTASYGAWPFDLVILLLPLLQVAARLPGAARPAVALFWACHLAINLLALALLLREVEYFWFLWITPALLAMYLLTRRALRPEAALPPATPAGGPALPVPAAVS
jgi:hypothetical protein